MIYFYVQIFMEFEEGPELRDYLRQLREKLAYGMGDYVSIWDEEWRCPENEDTIVKERDVDGQKIVKIVQTISFNRLVERITLQIDGMACFESVTMG